MNRAEREEEKVKGSMLRRRIRHRNLGLEIIWGKRGNLKRAPSNAGDASEPTGWEGPASLRLRDRKRLKGLLLG